MRKRKKRIPTWQIVISGLSVSFMLSGLCCFFIFRPDIGHSPDTLAVEAAVPLACPAVETPVCTGSEMDDTQAPSFQIQRTNAAALSAGLPQGHEEETGLAAGNSESVEEERPDIVRSEVVMDFGSEEEASARYKIETVEAVTRNVPYTVYARYCRRDPLTKEWEIIKEIGNPYYGRAETDIDSTADPLSDIDFVNVDGASVARGERSGYCWYGSSFFEAREQWAFFSGPRFKDVDGEDAQWVENLKERDK